MITPEQRCGDCKFFEYAGISTKSGEPLGKCINPGIKLDSVLDSSTPVKTIRIGVLQEGRSDLVPLLERIEAGEDQCFGLEVKKTKRKRKTEGQVRRILTPVEENELANLVEKNSRSVSSSRIFRRS
ncbi:MAG TPA: hypothetical protein VLF68_04035 [Candidatus Saccharimonadales bacterium]|nr:hypothetical protein [Candidatus Saccharimonadales bacterium]